MALFDWLIGNNNNQTPQLDTVIIEDPRQPQLTQKLQQQAANGNVTDRTRFKPFQNFFNKIADIDDINEPIETPAIKIGNFYNDRIKPLGNKISTGLLGEKINPYIENANNTFVDTDEYGNTRLNTAAGNTTRIGGFFNDWRSGFNDNYRNGFDVSNLTNDNGIKKGFGYRLGEGFGTLGRLAQSPLGRGLTVAGLVALTGGGALPALTFGGMAGMLNQQNRLNDTLFRNDLQKQGINTEGLKGYINKNTYEQLIKAKQLQDNEEFKRMYYQAQQKNQEEMMNFRKQQAKQAERQQAIENAYKTQVLNENIRHNKKQEALGRENVGIQRDKINAKNTPQLSNADKKTINENMQTLADIEAGLQLIEENPNAYSLVKGLMPSWMANRYDPKGIKTRTQIDNITAVYRKWLTGAQMSDAERKSYERFLPAPTDNYETVKAKLQGMHDSIERKTNVILQNAGEYDNADDWD